MGRQSCVYLQPTTIPIGNHQDHLPGVALCRVEMNAL
jgi:hypothetical protein